MLKEVKSPFVAPEKAAWNLINFLHYTHNATKCLSGGSLSDYMWRRVDTQKALHYLFFYTRSWTAQDP